MSVYVSNITIPVGADFEQTFSLEDNISNSYLDLSGYSASSILKKHPASLTTTAIFEVSFSNRNFGELAISLGSSITSLLKPGRYCYDILLSDGIKKSRVVEGSALVTAGVTKD